MVWKETSQSDSTPAAYSNLVHTLPYFYLWKSSYFNQNLRPTGGILSLSANKYKIHALAY